MTWTWACVAVSSERDSLHLDEPVGETDCDLDRLHLGLDDEVNKNNFLRSTQMFFRVLTNLNNINYTDNILITN